ncbi:protein ZNF365 isoform X3 [Echinops telfairi]|uniref:Protein ZNF365 isoform X3 n=1 Tax=Echinops telfairi TaxID=9371 RepID=A0AC55D734_ECHTE|nr:protein ZNF365 isoform X3 [Echinops telfairi]
MTPRVMQQKAFEESRYPWQESLENVAVCLPFRCPRCGDHTRFRSLSSLRAHLEFSHSYQERTLLTKCSLFTSLKDTDLVTSVEPLKQVKLQSSGSVVKQKPSYVNLYSISHDHSKDRKPFEVVAERPVSYVQTYTAMDLRADSLDGPRSSPGLPTSDTKAAFEAHVREKFNRMVEAVDRTIEKRIDKLTKELAQKTAELLEVRVAFVQLTQKKQEVQRRERALNRQVDVAVEMIASLRQRLTESEEELLRKEESRGHAHCVCNHSDLKAHFHPKGRSCLRKAREDRPGMQPAKSMHEQTEASRELCRPPKKGEPLGFSRKVNIRPKMAKKKPTAIVNII